MPNDTDVQASNSFKTDRPLRALLTDHPWPEVEIERQVLEKAGIELIAGLGPGDAANAEAIEALVAEHDPDAILTCWAQVSARAIASAPRLKIVARLGVGLDNIAVGAATDAGAWVTNVPDYCVEEVSDHAVALTLAAARGITRLDRAAKGGRWVTDGEGLSRVRDLTVGVVGYGRIGRATVAKLLMGFGCQVLVSSRGLDAGPLVLDQQHQASAVSLAEIQRRADVIVLHLPLTPATNHLVDAAFIGRCERKPWIVNVSRGGLISNDALLAALDAGSIAGAALDVIEGEPSPPEALLRHPRSIVTPHVAFLSTASLAELRTRAAEEVARVLTGHVPHQPCNAPFLSNGSAGVAAPTRPVADCNATAHVEDRDNTQRTVLTGGVASDIHIERSPDGSEIVVKTALPKLRVAADWRADPARSSIEVDALRVLRELLGPGSVPAVLWTDAENHRFAMERIAPTLCNWKSELLAGRIQLDTAARVGELLGTMHARSAQREDLASRFANRTFYEDLRVTPFFIRIAERNPSLASAIHEVIGNLDVTRTALVHGDFSPKNLLVEGPDVVVLDCEVAHWGDPRFDIGFVLSHLVLKGMRRGANRDAFHALCQRIIERYRLTGSPALLDETLVQVLGCLVLARLDGDSPVDYLHELDLQEVRTVANRLIQEPDREPETALRSIFREQGAVA